MLQLKSEGHLLAAFLLALGGLLAASGLDEAHHIIGGYLPCSKSTHGVPVMAQQKGTMRLAGLILGLIQWVKDPVLL